MAKIILGDIIYIIDPTIPSKGRGKKNCEKAVRLTAFSLFFYPSPKSICKNKNKYKYFLHKPIYMTLFHEKENEKVLKKKKIS